MNAASLLSELRRRDIRIWAVGGQLHCAARAGALTAELREQLKHRREELLGLLALAATLSTQERAIVPLQANGTRVPVFAVPGHNGDVFCYRALAQRLGEDQPFFGLQPPGADGQDEPLVRVEDIAACFARQIRAFAPTRRCVIAGYCAGGTVAFELAQQLSRAGARVELLALFGSPYPAYFRWPSQLRLRAIQQFERVASLGGAMLWSTPQEFRRYVAARLRQRRERIAAEQAAAVDPVFVLRDKVERATLQAVRAYSPQPFAGRLALVLPSRAWRLAAGWKNAAARVEEYFGPEGCGSQAMLREPYTAAFAELFKRALAQ